MRPFAELFRGNPNSYGEYQLPTSRKAKKGEKFTGGARTHQPDKKYYKGPLNADLYSEHLAGRFSLGVVPILPDDTTFWFALDIDRYDEGTMHAELCAKIEKLKLPFIVCRTKSDGAHVYCFFEEAISATRARILARDALNKLGLPDKTEIFPKQDSIQQKGSSGSWINLPYFGSARAATNGKSDLTLEEFITLANSKLVKASIAPKSPSPSKSTASSPKEFGEHSEAPPCIQKMMEDGIEEGGRDNALMHVGVYMKRAFNDDWQNRLQEFNSTYVTPAVGFTDLARITKSHERKEYQYLCKQQPMCAVCDKPVCLKRKFGVGQGEGAWTQIIVDRAVKVVSEGADPYYKMYIEGKEVRLSLDDVQSFNAFKKRYFAVFNKFPLPMTPKDYAEFMNAAMASCDEERVPDIVTPRGQIMNIFNSWCMSRIKDHNSPENVTNGAPYYDEKQRAVIFAGNDLATKVRLTYGSRYQEQIVWGVIAESGGIEDEITIGSKKIAIWKLPIADPFFELPTKEQF
jgi:hypothetical protein